MLWIEGIKKPQKGVLKLFGNGLLVSQQAVCFLDCGSTSFQFGFFCFVELNFYDAFNSIFPKYDGNSDTQVLQYVFALYVRFLGEGSLFAKTGSLLS